MLCEGTGSCSLNTCTVQNFNDNAINNFLLRARVLPLAPTHNIEDVWFDAFIGDRQPQHNHQHNANHRLCHLILDRDKQILWNQHKTGSRTTNHLEGWRHKLKNHVQSPHTNIFNFIIKLIQNQQVAAEIRIIQYQAGGGRTQRKRKYLQIDDRLQILKRRLRDIDLTTERYADAASYLLYSGIVLKLCFV